MRLYACMWPDGSLTEEGDGIPFVATTRKAAAAMARMIHDDDGPRIVRAKVVWTDVEWHMPKNKRRKRR